MKIKVRRVHVVVVVAAVVVVVVVMVVVVVVVGTNHSVNFSLLSRKSVFTERPRGVAWLRALDQKLISPEVS